MMFCLFNAVLEIHVTVILYSKLCHLQISLKLAVSNFGEMFVLLDFLIIVIDKVRNKFSQITLAFLNNK